MNNKINFSSTKNKLCSQFFCNFRGFSLFFAAVLEHFHYFPVFWWREMVLRRKWTLNNWSYFSSFSMLDLRSNCWNCCKCLLGKLKTVVSVLQNFYSGGNISYFIDDWIGHIIKVDRVLDEREGIGMKEFSVILKYS